MEFFTVHREQKMDTRHLCWPLTADQYFLKCFTVHAEPDFVVSGSVLDSLAILPPIFIPLSFLLLIHYLVRPLFYQLFSFQIHLPYIPPTDRLLENKLSPSFDAKNSYFHKFVLRTPFRIHIFTRKQLLPCCSRDFVCGTAGELSSSITNFFGGLTMWMIVGDSWW